MKPTKALVYEIRDSRLERVAGSMCCILGDLRDWLREMKFVLYCIARLLMVNE